VEPRRRKIIEGTAPSLIVHRPRPLIFLRYQATKLSFYLFRAPFLAGNTKIDVHQQAVFSQRLGEEASNTKA
jgi:hypothetical protein